MIDEKPSLSVQPYGDRWAVLVGDEVVLVSETQESAESVVVTANDVLAQSGIARGPERRSFSDIED